MIPQLILVLDEIRRRSSFKQIRQHHEVGNIWPLNNSFFIDNKWMNTSESFFIKGNGDFFNGVNLIFCSKSMLFNPLYDSNHLYGLKHFLHSLNPKPTIIVDGKKENFKNKKYLFNIFFLNKYLYFLLFSHLYRLPRFLRFNLYLLQTFFLIFLFFLIRPRSIFVAHIHRYWQVVLVAKIFNIKTFHYMHGIICPASRDFSPFLLDKFRSSIPDIFLHPNRVSYFQVLSLKMIPADNCFLLPFQRNKSSSLITHEKNRITLLGTWFVDTNNKFLYPHILYTIFSTIKEKYPNYSIQYVPHPLESDPLPKRLVDHFDVNISSSDKLSSKRIFSFCSTLSIEMFDFYSIPSTLITIDSISYNYTKSLCQKLSGFDVINIETNNIKYQDFYE